MSTQADKFPFRLVDLFILFTILGLTMALIPSCLMRSPSRRRPVCTNQITQLCLAAINFENAKGHFPGYQSVVGGRNSTWLVQLMPYMDKNDLYTLWNDPAIPTKDLPLEFESLYVCPSNPNIVRNVPANSYVANAGMAGWMNEKPANGMFHDLINSSVVTTIGDIRDGASNTILISENLQAGQWHVTGKEATVMVWHPTTTPLPVHLINGEKKTARLSADSARPSSYHPGGVMAGFCDKSVFFLSDDIDYKVYMQLMTPDGARSDMPQPFKTYQLRDSDYRH